MARTPDNVYQIEIIHRGDKTVIRLDNKESLDPGGASAAFRYHTRGMRGTCRLLAPNGDVIATMVRG